MESIINSLNILHINADMHIYAIAIQKIWRSYIIKRRCLPIILRISQAYLRREKISLNTSCEDGRVNSSLDENIIIAKLQSFLGSRIIVPKIRMWYDILLRDPAFGWIPINIKTTTMRTSDNTGNLAMCVYAYTNHDMDLHSKYTNGAMSKILINKLNSKTMYHPYYRDYYFIVINKCDPDMIIINSVRGFNKLTHNAHNLPFQILWMSNRSYIQKPISESIEQFTDCINKTKLTWQTEFISEIKKISK